MIGDILDLRATEGDLSRDQNSDPPSLDVFEIFLDVDLDLDLIKGDVMELDDDIIDDCLENCPMVLAASSKAALEDIEDNLVSVSTYITASSCLENERARLEDT